MTTRAKKELKGQVTIFSMLLFMVVLALLLAQFRSAVFYMRRASVERAARLSVESLLAGYNKPLKEYYQILAVNGGFGQAGFQEEKLEEQLEQVFNANLLSSWEFSENHGTVEEPIFTPLIGGDWDFFLREICLNRKEAMVDVGTEFVVSKWREENTSAMGDLSQKKEAAQAAVEAESSDEVEAPEDVEGQEESDATGKVEDPRKFVEEIWNQGILVAACPENYEISEKTCSMSDVSFPEAGRRIQDDIDFMDDENIQNLFKGWENTLEIDSGIQSGINDLAAQMYMFEVFKDASLLKKDQVEHDRVLDYELEYILAGNESDRENLKTVLWKLLALRCVMNLAYLLGSPQKGVQVEETALILSAALLIPQFVEVIAFLLKVSWAFAEGLADCRTLLRGGKIPILKDDTSWYLTWEKMLQLNGQVLEGNKGDGGLDYAGYLTLFLTLTNRDTKYRRMTNLMEKNIRLEEGYENFRMEQCIYGVQAIFACELGMNVNYRAQAATSY